MLGKFLLRRIEGFELLIEALEKILVASSFDLWQKDAFFSAAEEVQDSADILDSAYRLWLKVKKEGPASVVDELHRELRTALGTAKWQLDEFERATRLSHGSCRDENRSTRHQQFVVVMETQILDIENELNKSLCEEGRQPLQWVNLDQEEKDELAMFLSGSWGDIKDERVKEVMCREKASFSKLKEIDCGMNINNGEMNMDLQCQLKGSSKDEIAIDIDSVREVPRARDEVFCSVDRTVGSRRTCNMPNFGSWQIVVPDDHERSKKLATCIEATPKVKGSRVWNSFPIRAVGWINQIPQCYSIFGSKMQNPWHLYVNQSVQRMTTLLLILFLLVSLVLYST